MANKAVNTFTKGLKLSNDPINQDKDSYSFALNAVKNNIVSNPEQISNEKGFTEYINLGYEYTLLGTRYLGKKEYLLFIKNPENSSVFNRIILINNGEVVRTVLDRSDLNFSSSHPIISTYRINYKNQRIVYFVDGLNADRVINIDTDNTGIDTDLFSINSTANRPNLEATVLDSGGSLLSGQYFIAISYNLGDDFTTSPLIISKGISIASGNYYNDAPLTDSNVKAFGLTDGDVIGTPTRKAIKITTTNVDPNYDSYNIIVVRKTENADIVRVVENIDVAVSEFTFSGQEGELNETLSLNDIIVDSVNYYASEAIIQKDNRLLRANSKLSGSNVDYQRFANQIVVKYKINEELVYDLKGVVNACIANNIDDGAFYDAVANGPKKHSISPSYLANTANVDVDNMTLTRDETYSLGVGFELEDGTETEVFHIPGRPLNINSDSTGLGTGLGEYNRSINSGLPSMWDDDIVDSQPRWRVRNTAINNGTLGYWRSSSVYPEGYDYPSNGEKNIAGRSYIRHHKMPSDILEPIYRTEIVGNPNHTRAQGADYKLYKRNLGLVFSNIVIPDELKSRIKKINFFYTPRDASNKSILSKGLIYRLYKNANNQLEQSWGFNYEGDKSTQSTTYDFVSPDVDFNFKNSTLSGNKIKVCGLDKGYINYVGAQLNQNYKPFRAYLINSFSNNTYNQRGRQASVVSGMCFYNQRAIPKEDVYSRNVDKVIFVDNNFSGISEGLNFNFRDSQDSAVISLLEPLAITPTSSTNLQTYYPELQFNANEDNVSYDGRNVYLTDSVINSAKNQLGDNLYNAIIDNFQNNALNNKVYYDSAFYVSIVNTIDSQYGDVNDLKYVKFNSVLNYTTGNIVSKEVVGGDTFIEVHHFRKTKSYETKDDGTNRAYSLNQSGRYFKQELGNVGNIISRAYEMFNQGFGSFFCETDLNIRMRRQGTGQDENYFPKYYYNTNYEDLNGRFLTKEYYNIDAPYNQFYIKNYFAANLKIDSINNTDNRYFTRIIYSDKQNLEDKVDNYRKIRANNYRDLPLDKGGISILFVFQDKLYAVSRDTLFNVFTSNQSLQTLNETNITVGTGEFLGTEPIDIMTIDGGYAGTSSKLSFVESPYGYLFIDRYKGKIILFNNKLDDISLKDINEFYRENYDLKLLEQLREFDTDFDNPLNNYGYVCGYDAELNRFLITKLDYRLVTEELDNYKGVYNPNTEYQPGDIYLKDGNLYKVNSASSEEYITKVDTNNLSDFIISNISELSYTYTNPVNGTIDNSNQGTIVYTPNQDYVGFDNFNIVVNCKLESINIDVSLISYTGKWIVDDSASYCEQEILSAKWVIDDTQSYCEPELTNLGIVVDGINGSAIFTDNNTKWGIKISSQEIPVASNVTGLFNIVDINDNIYGTMSVTIPEGNVEGIATGDVTNPSGTDLYFSFISLTPESDNTYTYIYAGQP